MRTVNRQYSYRVIFEADEGGYHAYVPVLTGCHSWGKTLSEAKKNIREAIRSHVASLVKDKKKVPTDEGLETFETFSSADFNRVSV